MYHGKLIRLHLGPRQVQYDYIIRKHRQPWNIRIVPQLWADVTLTGIVTA
jgi:hypothetical protein